MSFVARIKFYLSKLLSEQSLEVSNLTKDRYINLAVNC